MSTIGEGSGHSWPTAIDGRKVEVDSPNPGKTKVKAGGTNDERGLLIQIEQTLGINPHGSAASVAARLAKELNNDGTQKVSSFYAADTGSANAYAAAYDPVLAAHIVGKLLFFKAANANSGASTFSPNGVGAVAIKKAHDKDLEANDIEVGSIVGLMHDGTVYQMVTVPAVIALSLLGSGTVPAGVTVPASQLGSGTVPAGVVVPLARIGVTATHTTASLAANASETLTVTHGLGTDNVKVLLMAKASGSGGEQWKWAVLATRPDGMWTQLLGDGNGNAGAAITSPSAGQVRINAINRGANPQTITFSYTILRED